MIKSGRATKQIAPSKKKSVGKNKRAPRKTVILGYPESEQLDALLAFTPYSSLAKTIRKLKERMKLKSDASVEVSRTQVLKTEIFYTRHGKVYQAVQPAGRGSRST